MMQPLARISSFLICCFFFFVSCKKETFITSPDADVRITVDSLAFDTVFTTTGSVTQAFKIINENNQKLRLTQVKLLGGSTSAYKININGVATTEENNIEIAADDSIYVFVSVTIDPTAANLPFIVTDSILVSYNGTNRFVKLEAFGQNAHFLRDQVITGNVNWTNDLPYVILGGLRIDTTATLTIASGCKVYAHANAALLVDGTLIANGEKNNEVVFTGDRLDPDYRNLPASWPGIYFRNTSKDNVLKFAIIKNATQAIVVSDPPVNTNPKLILHQSVIDNAFNQGLLSINSAVDADNSLFSNCGANIDIRLGGNYSFTNCTVACYSNLYLLHSNPVLQLADFLVSNGGLITADLNANFRNCIFWGDGGALDDEVVTTKEGSNIYNVTLENCLYKALNDPANTTLTTVIRNIDPVFDSIDISNGYFDFRTTRDPFAPGIDQGINTAFLKDLDDRDRVIGTSTDLGSYEKP